MELYTAINVDTDKYGLGESPYYDPRFNRYSWVDINNNTLWTMKDGVKEAFNLGQPIGAAVPMKNSDGFLLAAMDGLYILNDGQATVYRDLTKVFKPYWRSNDAKADHFGRLWFGASVADDDHEAEGNLYLLRGNDIECMVPETKISNGMAWSGDRKSFFFSDSLKHAVFKYDFNDVDGTISGKKILFEVSNGISDGLTIDADDNLWVAFWGGHRIEKRSGETGEKLAEIIVAAENVTSCCFSGENMNTLFITTSGDGKKGEHDGCLFKCEVDAVGLEPDYWEG